MSGTRKRAYETRRQRSTRPTSPRRRRTEHWLLKRTPHNQNRQRSGTGDGVTLTADDELVEAIVLVVVVVVVVIGDV